MDIIKAVFEPEAADEPWSQIASATMLPDGDDELLDVGWCRLAG